MPKTTKRLVTVAGGKVAVRIYTAIDTGSAADQDEWGCTHVCEYDFHSGFNRGDDPAFVRTIGHGPSDAAAIKAFVANVHRHAEEDF